MSSTEITMLLILILLMMLSAFFSSAETAFTTVSSIQIRSLIEENNKKAKLVDKIINNKSKMLSAILIGNNLVNISASALSTLLAQKMFGEYAVSFATGLLTIIVLIFGEITPKSMATTNALKLSLFYSKIIYGLMFILTPFIYIINLMSNIILRMLRIDPNAKVNSITETELRTIVEVSHEEGVIEKEERQMINNVFDFGDAVASDVMVPKVDMTMADINSTYDELISIFREEKYTRIPIYQDSTDNVIGIINMKDLLLYNPNEIFDVRNYLRSAFFTYETKKISELMMEMKKTSVNIVIVLDEYGVTSGLITLEDLLEEIVGEIHDEYDLEEEDAIREISANKYLVEGQIKIADLNDRLNLSLHSEEYDSIGGLIIEKLDRFPNPEDKVIIDNVSIRVLSMDKMRIDTVEIIINSPKNEAPVNEE
ncbi:MAG: HlyC/CorC family transporter [Lachnospiraceae bacterium]|nr:HlyC/CorC family transporter [Lachnospiraceae bacterium]